MKLRHTDLRQLLRLIRRRPTFYGMIVFILAIGVGANTAIFSFVEALLLQPLPYRDAHELVILRTVKGGEQGMFSYPEYFDLRDRFQGFEDLAAYNPGAAYNVYGGGQAPEELTATLCTHNLFELLGVDMALGRAWPEEYDRRRAFGLLLNHDLWERRFSRRSSVLDSIITLDGASEYQIFGMVSKGFSFPFYSDLFRSICITNRQVENRAYRGVYLIGRMRPGQSVGELNQALAAFSREQAELYPPFNGGVAYEAELLEELYLGRLRPYLKLLGAAALLLLLIAGINAANLLLVQAVRREKEVVIRSIVGASPGSIYRRFLSESFLLAGVGGALGVWISTLLIRFLRNLAGDNLPYWVQVEINPAAVLFALGLVLILGLGTGLAPAVRFTRGRFGELIKSDRGTTGLRSHHRLRSALVVSQIALGFVLLASASLITRSFLNLKSTDLGYQTEQVLSFRTALPWFKYGGDSLRKVQFYQTALAELRAAPGVAFAELNTNLPMTSTKENRGSYSQVEITLEDQSSTAQQENPYLNLQHISSGYLDAMGIDLVTGEAFPTDPIPHSRLALLNEEAARQLWPGQNPVGRRLKLGKPGEGEVWLTVTGVVRDVRHFDVRSTDAPALYVPFDNFNVSNAHFVVKTTLPEGEAMDRFNRAIWKVDPEQSTYDVRLMDERVAKSIWENKISSDLFLLFALVAALLAAAGLFSLMAYSVAQRTRELGIRKVLGASEGRIFNLVLVEVLRLSLLGIVIGLAIAIPLSSWFGDLLYGVSRLDPLSILLAGAGLLGMAVLAVLYPVGQAVRVDPVEALRGE